MLLVQVAGLLGVRPHLRQGVHVLADQDHLVQALGRVEDGPVLAVAVRRLQQALLALVQGLCVTEAGCWRKVM